MKCVPCPASAIRTDAEATAAATRTARRQVAEPSACRRGTLAGVPAAARDGGGRRPHSAAPCPCACGRGRWARWPRGRCLPGGDRVRGAEAGSSAPPHPFAAVPRLRQCRKPLRAGEGRGHCPRQGMPSMGGGCRGDRLPYDRDSPDPATPRRGPDGACGPPPMWRRMGRDSRRARRSHARRGIRGMGHPCQDHRDAAARDRHGPTATDDPRSVPRRAGARIVRRNVRRRRLSSRRRRRPAPVAGAARSFWPAAWPGPGGGGAAASPPRAGTPHAARRFQDRCPSSSAPALACWCR